MGIAKVPQGTKRHDGPNGIVRPPLDVALGKEKPHRMRIAVGGGTGHECAVLRRRLIR